MKSIDQKPFYEENNEKTNSASIDNDTLLDNPENISSSLRMPGLRFGMSVTQRIKIVKQPYGGYLPRKNFEIISRNDGIVLNETENIAPGIVGTVVDYLTRFMMGTPLENTFTISLQGARLLDIFSSPAKKRKNIEQENSKRLLSKIVGLDSKSVFSACQLVGYDTCFRAGPMAYKPVDEIKPDKATIENIITMVNRSLTFFTDYGPVVKSGFTFEGGYTDKVSSGDGDFLTEDTLWDFKVSKGEPTSKKTLQLLMYYIMGCHSIHPEFKSIKSLGIFNPRKNKIYRVDTNAICPAIIDEVSEKVIGYK